MLLNIPKLKIIGRINNLSPYSHTHKPPFIAQSLITQLVFRILKLAIHLMPYTRIATFIKISSLKSLYYAKQTKPLLGLALLITSFRLNLVSLNQALLQLKLTKPHNLSNSKICND